MPAHHSPQQSLAAAPEQDDLSILKRPLAALQQPFSYDLALAMYGEPAPGETTAGYRTFRGT